MTVFLCPKCDDLLKDNSSNQTFICQSCHTKWIAFTDEDEILTEDDQEDVPTEEMTSIDRNRVFWLSYKNRHPNPLPDYRYYTEEQMKAALKTVDK